MRKNIQHLILNLILCLLITTGCGQQSPTKSETPKAETTSKSYDDYIVQAKELVKEGKLDKALAAIQAAAKLDPKRYEAPASAALILLAAKKPAEAKTAIQDAIRLAPEDKRLKLQEIAKQIDDAVEVKTPVAVAEPTKLESGKPTGAARRQLDTLILITEEADKAKTGDERNALLQEFLNKSEPFLNENPNELPVWTLRAVAALELNQAKASWEAGQQMIKLGAENSDDAKTRKVMALLERRGWLGKEVPAVAKLNREQPLQEDDQLTWLRNTCINNLRQLDGAIQQWALENKKTGDSVATTADVTPYLKQFPVCPSGGTYTMGRIDQEPKCSLTNHALVKAIFSEKASEIAQNSRKQAEENGKKAEQALLQSLTGKFEFRKSDANDYVRGNDIYTMEFFGDNTFNYFHSIERIYSDDRFKFWSSATITISQVNIENGMLKGSGKGSNHEGKPFDVPDIKLRVLTKDSIRWETDSGGKYDVILSRIKD